MLLLARAYRPVADEDYLRDLSVGAMMGPEAIRKALEWAMVQGHAMLSTCTRMAAAASPDTSGVDIRENAKFVPDFFKVAPQCAHGALVLSNDAARGQIWLDRRGPPAPVDLFVEVGRRLRQWRE